MGVNMKAVQERLGHSDIAITLGRYSHLLPNIQQDAVTKWDDALKGENKEDDKEAQ
jgi:integrase